MSNFVLVIVLLYSNSDAFIDISRPMPYAECAVMEAQVYTPAFDKELDKLGEKPYSLKWAVCREVTNE